MQNTAHLLYCTSGMKLGRGSCARKVLCPLFSGPTAGQRGRPTLSGLQYQRQPDHSQMEDLLAVVSPHPSLPLPPRSRFAQQQLLVILSSRRFTFQCHHPLLPSCHLGLLESLLYSVTRLILHVGFKETTSCESEVTRSILKSVLRLLSPDLNYHPHTHIFFRLLPPQGHLRWHF